VTPGEAYNLLLLQDEAAARAQAAALEEGFVRAGVTFDGRPMRSFLRPHFVERAEWNRLRDQGGRLLETAARVARQAFDGDAGRLCAWLGVPEREARWVGLDPGPPDVVLSRLDAFLTPDGPRFIEINSDAPAGFGYGDRMAAVFQELPVFRAFATRHKVGYLASGPALVATVMETWRGAGRPPAAGAPVAAIVDFADVKTRPDQEILRQAFQDAGIACVLADPRELALQGESLVAGDRAIDVVYRRAVLAELLDREAEVREFLEAYRRRASVFVNSFRCHLSEDKAFLALLQAPEFGRLLTPGERALVAAVLPWTARLEETRLERDGRMVDLLPWVLAQRPRLVLKPAHSYGGRSVHVGDETGPDAWQRAVLEGIHQGWIVQERVPIPEERFPMVEADHLVLESLKVNASPFYVAGAEVGAVTRASRGSVINVSAGGGSVPTFVVG
jgi:hypothetical protein